jgi:hypothetical protein
MKSEDHKLSRQKAQSPRDARVSILSLLTFASRPATKAVERLKIAVIGVSNWYIDPNHFNLDDFPLDVIFGAGQGPQPSRTASLDTSAPQRNTLMTNNSSSKLSTSSKSSFYASSAAPR